VVADLRSRFLRFEVHDPRYYAGRGWPRRQPARNR
jgi:hypothetical protein